MIPQKTACDEDRSGLGGLITPVDFKNGMRHLCGAVAIITTENQAVRAGMTATAVCSLTADPPMLLVCVNKAATSHQPILISGRFCVNVLSADDVEVARRFSFGDMDSRFQIGAWTRLRRGGLALDSALVTFDCSVVGNIPVETHSIFLARVEDVIIRAKRSPLIYVDGQYAHVSVP